MEATRSEAEWRQLESPAPRENAKCVLTAVHGVVALGTFLLELRGRTVPIRLRSLGCVVTSLGPELEVGFPRSGDFGTAMRF